MIVSTICTLSTLSSDLKIQSLLNFLALDFLTVSFLWCSSTSVGSASKLNTSTKTKIQPLDMFKTGLLIIRNYSEIISKILNACMQVYRCFLVFIK